MTHEEKLADMRAAVDALNARNKALESEVAAKVDALQRAAEETERWRTLASDLAAPHYITIPELRAAKLREALEQHKILTRAGLPTGYWSQQNAEVRHARSEIGTAPSVEGGNKSRPGPER